MLKQTLSAPPLHLFAPPWHDASLSFDFDVREVADADRGAGHRATEQIERARAAVVRAFEARGLGHVAFALRVGPLKAAKRELSIDEQLRAFAEAPRVKRA